MKDIIIKEVGEQINIITDPDDLLQFLFFDKISLIDNSLNVDNFVWTLVFNIDPFELKENENQENFIIALDIYYNGTNKKITTKIYYNIDDNNYESFSKAIEKYIIIEGNLENIEKIKLEYDKVIKKINNILNKLNFDINKK